MMVKAILKALLIMLVAAQFIDLLSAVNDESENSAEQTNSETQNEARSSDGTKGKDKDRKSKPNYRDAANKVAEQVEKSSKRAHELRDEHLDSVKEKPSELISKEMIANLAQQNLFLPRKAGTHSISLEAGQGYNGISNYQPSSWKITQTMTGPAEKAKTASPDNSQPFVYPMGLGPVLLNQCTERSYTKSSPCYNSKLFERQSSLCKDLMDSAADIGVGFDGRGAYNSNSRRASLVQRVCQNKVKYHGQDVPDACNVYGIYHTVAKTESFQSVDQYMKYIREKAGLSNQKGLFHGEAKKHGSASAYAANLGGVGAVFGALAGAAGGPKGAILGATLGGAVGSTMEVGQGSGKGNQASSERGNASSDTSQSDSASSSQKETHTFFAEMDVDVMLYEMSLDEVKPTDLSLAFLKDYMDLPSSYYSVGAAVHYQNFLLRWGTHYVRAAKFGGQLKVTKVMQTDKSLTSEQFAQVAESEFKSMFSALNSDYSKESSSMAAMGFSAKKESANQRESGEGEGGYKGKLNIGQNRTQNFQQSEFTETSVEAQGGSPEIAQALFDFYSPSFKQRFHDWITSIKDYPKPFEFQLKQLPDLLNMRMKDLFPDKDFNLGCAGSGSSEFKIQIESGTNRKFYTDFRVTVNGNETVTKTIKVYCKYNSSEQFSKDIVKRKTSLERAISIFLAEGPFPTSSYELAAGEVGCEFETRSKFSLFTSHTEKLKFIELKSKPFLLVLDLPRPIPRIATTGSKFQMIYRDGTWFATAPGAAEAHLYEGCTLAGAVETQPKICFRNIVLTYSEKTGFFYIDPSDFTLSKRAMPSLPTWLSGITVARPRRLKSTAASNRDIVNKEIAVPCNVKWLNSHRLDPNRNLNCLHFTAVTEGDIFVMFASVPKAHVTWRYLHISLEGVTFYKGFKPESSVYELGLGLLGDTNLYQSYFVCVEQMNSKLHMQYGKADPDSDVGTVYASYTYVNDIGFSRMSFFSFGAGDKSVSLMDVRLTEQLPKIKCYGDHLVKRGQSCELICHDQCDGCKRAHDNSACQRCVNVRVKIESVTECHQTCPAGYTFASGNLCEPCSAGTYKGDEGNKMCNQCPIGSFSAEGATQCSLCDEGHFNDKEGQGECIKCAAGTFSSRKGATNCSSCDAGSFSKSGSAHCSLCHFGHFGDKRGLKSCYPCAKDTFAADRGQTECDKCPAGSGSVEGSMSCNNSCLMGEFSPRFGVNCSKCEAGSFAESAGSSFCSKCEPGFYQDEEGQSSCIEAPKGTFAAEVGASSVTECLAGTSNDKEGQSSSSACVRCKPGHHSASNGSATCTKCDAGSYQPDFGQQQCLLAQPGHFVKGRGKLDQIKCELGTFAASGGATECELCPVGHEGSTEGLIRCQECPAGQFTNVNGTVNCVACPGGEISVAGAAACTKCGAGTFSNDGVTCAECREGTYSSEGSISCSKCPSGHFAAGTGSPKCTQCPAGYYASHSGSARCTQCAAGYAASNKGSSYCTQCAAGTAASLQDTTKCTKCRAGWYAPTGGSSVCKKCVAGSIAPYRGSSSCSKCDRGKFSSDNSERCLPCSKGTYSKSSGSAKCTKCEKGRYASSIGSTECSLCEPGSIASGEGNEKCIKCRDKDYATKAGWGECKTCKGEPVDNTFCQVVEKELHLNFSQGAGYYSVGDWLDWQMCPVNAYVNQINGKYYGPYEFMVLMDPTGLSGIQMICSDGTILQNEGGSGTWLGAKPVCNKFFDGVIIAHPKPKGDLYGAVNYAMRCMDNNGWQYATDDRKGKNASPLTCPRGSAICGYQVQMLPYQGPFGDDMDINQLKVRCCKLVDFM